MGSPLDLLPPDIIINIFCRLDVHSILQCKRVCRTWRSIIFDTHFAHMHIKSSIYYYSKKNSFLLFPDQVSKTCNGLCIREFDDENNNYGPCNWIYHSPIDRNSFIIGSCNGLICLSSTQGYEPRKNYSVRVCNPITREYITLPSLYPNGQRFKIGSGFGFSPCAKEYKVVRIYYHIDDQSLGLVHVYTVGDGRGWRYKGQVGFSLLYTNRNHIGVFANGSLYWLLDGGSTIVCFDLAQEEFTFILLPPCIYDTLGYWNKPFFSGGLLCFADRQFRCYLEPICIRIWSLKKNGEWEIIFHFGYDSMYFFEPLAITERALGEDDVKIVESEKLSMKSTEENRSSKRFKLSGSGAYIKGSSNRYVLPPLPNTNNFGIFSRVFDSSLNMLKRVKFWVQHKVVH